MRFATTETNAIYHVTFSEKQFLHTAKSLLVIILRIEQKNRRSEVDEAADLEKVEERDNKEDERKKTTKDESSSSAEATNGLTSPKGMPSSKQKTMISDIVLVRLEEIVYGNAWKIRIQKSTKDQELVYY